MRNTAARDPLRTLFWLVVVNIAASISHYTDNLLFLEDYPEPEWIEPHLIDGSGS